jgi:hypothetical protein
MRRPLARYDFATAPFWISLYMRENFILFFISVEADANVNSLKKLYQNDQKWEITLDDRQWKGEEESLLGVATEYI